MSEYQEVGVFNGIAFGISDMQVTIVQGTLKTNYGKSLVEKDIPLRNTTNKVITIQGVIDGRSRTVGQTVSTAIENDRDSLISAADGYKKAYSDGRHSFDAVIMPGTLVWEDSASRAQGQPYRFTMVIKSW